MRPSSVVDVFEDVTTKEYYSGAPWKMRLINYKDFTFIGKAILIAASSPGDISGFHSKDKRYAKSENYQLVEECNDYSQKTGISFSGKFARKWLGTYIDSTTYLFRRKISEEIVLWKAIFIDCSQLTDNVESGKLTPRYRIGKLIELWVPSYSSLIIEEDFLDNRGNYDYEDSGPYCGACQQQPCMCSDPERTSMTIDF